MTHGEFGIYDACTYSSGQLLEVERVAWPDHPGVDSGLTLIRQFGGGAFFACNRETFESPKTLLICRTDDPVDGDTFLAAYVQRPGWVPGWYCGPSRDDLIATRDER